ncbi:uncharacterized protein LOC130641818 [Hydractinia symbiolongicarpus]|uniref:uncharacterized protein LOC130641818 n=1 Tax=Hydractinia symbiolongicarpus TaxID=13093 RepID=UPI00254A33AE|nr:uncharacterized protein LOC130641818 [Hydractinia symbiolongicarpus]XP_057304773.1 uncharacterized protein LOC130641818 [Hydractinia symbiolongicarpus]
MTETGCGELRYIRRPTSIKFSDYRMNLPACMNSINSKDCATDARSLPKFRKRRSCDQYFVTPDTSTRHSIDSVKCEPNFINPKDVSASREVITQSYARRSRSMTQNSIHLPSLTIQSLTGDGTRYTSFTDKNRPIQYGRTRSKTISHAPTLPKINSQKTFLATKYLQKWNSMHMNKQDKIAEESSLLEDTGLSSLVLNVTSSPEFEQVLSEIQKDVRDISRQSWML